MEKKRIESAFLKFFKLLPVGGKIIEALRSDLFFKEQNRDDLNALIKASNVLSESTHLFSDKHIGKMTKFIDLVNELDSALSKKRLIKKNRKGCVLNPRETYNYVSKLPNRIAESHRSLFLYTKTFMSDEDADSFIDDGVDNNKIILWADYISRKVLVNSVFYIGKTKSFTKNDEVFSELYDNHGKEYDFNKIKACVSNKRFIESDLRQVPYELGFKGDLRDAFFVVVTKKNCESICFYNHMTERVLLKRIGKREIHMEAVPDKTKTRK